MKYTNKYKIPEIVVQWLKHDEYDHQPGVFSATSLLKPIRATILEHMNRDILSVDVSDLIASRYGTAIHDSYEKVGLRDCVQEKRLYGEVGGFKISGKPDILFKKDKNLYMVMDIKSTSVWTYIFNSRIEDYIIQMSIYRWLAIKNGYDVLNTGTIIYHFTDWSRKKSTDSPDYPQLRILTRDYSLKSVEEIEAWMMMRLKLIQKYAMADQDKMPECTDQELWRNFLVMKKTRKTPVKKCQTKEEAEEFIAKQDHDHYIEVSPANRCNYCLARPICSQAKKLEEDGMIAE